MCHICDKFRHTALSCFVLRNALNIKPSSTCNLNPTCMVATNQRGSVDALNTWLFDSRASYHLTFDFVQLPNSTLFTSNEGIFVGDDTQIYTSSIGSGALHVSDT